MSFSATLPVSVTRRAPAKVNLALHVVGRRPDGYHEIESVVAFTAFGDEITARSAERDGLIVRGPWATGIEGENLIDRARQAARAHISGSHPVELVLDKRIPVAAGLGGGSADAAATLHALAELWRFPADEQALCEIGMPLGADVPMCVVSRPLLASGIGERMVPLDEAGLSGLAIVLVNPGRPVATPDVFAALERPSNSGLPERDDGPFVWLAGCRNDLTAVATRVCPEIADALHLLAEADIARMSGSGATCFGLFRDGDAADRTAHDIAARHPGWFVERTHLL